MESGFEPSGLGKVARAGRPTRDLILALVYTAAGIMAVLAAFFPPSSVSPTTVPGVIGAISIVAGLALLAPRGPLPAWALRTCLIGGIVVLSVLVSSVETELGTAVTAVPYIWFCVYFGAYTEPREARILEVFLCACFGIALIVSDVPATARLWLIYCGTIAVTTEALLASNNALRVQATEDPLTGLLNRRGLEESIGPILAIGERIGKPTALALIDLDDFKAVNDAHGHVAGDRVLKELGHSWSAAKRDTDLLARFGGDEFIVVMPATDHEQAEALVERLGSSDSIAWSGGVVEFRPGEDLISAVNRADQALYVDKVGAGDAPAEVLPES